MGWGKSSYRPAPAVDRRGLLDPETPRNLGRSYEIGHWNPLVTPESYPRPIHGCSVPIPPPFSGSCGQVNLHSVHRPCQWRVCGTADRSKCVAISALPQQGHSSGTGPLIIAVSRSSVHEPGLYPTNRGVNPCRQAMTCRTTWHGVDPSRRGPAGRHERGIARNRLARRIPDISPFIPTRDWGIQRAHPVSHDGEGERERLPPRGSHAPRAGGATGARPGASRPPHLRTAVASRLKGPLPLDRVISKGQTDPGAQGLPAWLRGELCHSTRRTVLPKPKRPRPVTSRPGSFRLYRFPSCSALRFEAENGLRSLQSRLGARRTTVV
jgi:hypothetical protein